MAILQADHPSYRFIVLFFNCMLTFGSYYCFDMPSVLQDHIQHARIPCNGTQPNETTNSTCCDDCLDLNARDYNLLYAIYAWTNAVLVIFAGFLIDKLGNSIGLFLFSFLCLVGSSIFTVGSMLYGTSAMFPMMLLGRLLFGSGNGALTVVQNRLTSFWFEGKELALAFGITLAFSRAGSVLNFFFTESLYEMLGMSGTLWLGAGLCGFGFISAIIVIGLDKHGTKQLGTDGDIKTASKLVKPRDILNFNVSFWLLALTIMFFYNGVFPFVADAAKFIQDKYNIAAKTSSYYAGAVYDVSMVMSPFLGGIIDYVGFRGVLCSACALLTIPVFGILAFTEVPPLVATLWLGVTYSIAAASMWPSIPLVVQPAYIGTAMGIATSIQMIGIGVSNLIIGSILDMANSTNILTYWKYVMVYLLANVLGCVTTTTLLNIMDRKNHSVLNKTKKRKTESDPQPLPSSAPFVHDASLPDADEERTPLLGSGSVQRSNGAIVA